MFDRIKNLEKFLSQKQKEGLFTHYYLGIGSLKEAEPRVKLEGDKPEDLFDLASLTKALVTTPLFFKTLLNTERSELFKLTFGAWLGSKSSFFHPRVNKIKVLDLLSHNSGLVPWRNFWIERCLKEGGFVPHTKKSLLLRLNYFVEKNHGLEREAYSDLGFILLALGLELRSGLSLSNLFQRYCSQSLGLFSSNLVFGPDLKNKKRAVPTGACELRGRNLQGEVHDENCGALGGVSGHAGLFGGGEDTLRFLRAYWPTQGARLMVSLCKEGSPHQAFGWRPGLRGSARFFAEGRALGHLGFTGCSFWVDPESSFYVLFLSNRIVFSRINPNFFEIRKFICSSANEILGLS